MMIKLFIFILIKNLKTIRYSFYLISILFAILSIFYIKNKMKKKKRKDYKKFSERINKENQSIIELQE